MNAVLEAKNLCKSFGALRVADDVNFSLERGARTALIGPNGAGKTTFVNLVTGMITPSGGAILFEGNDVTASPASRRARLGLLRTFQITRLFRALTVADNIRLSILQRSRKSMLPFISLSRVEGLDEKTNAVLRAVRLTDRAGTSVEKLAYGEQRLVEIAIALAAEPKVLLLDEPAAGVPQSESSIILDAIAGLPPDLAVLFIEHDMDLVFRFARRIAVLVNGALLTSGTPSEIAKDQRVRDVYLGKSRHAVQ